MPDRDSTIELLNGLIVILIPSKLFPRVSNRETIPTQCRFLRARVVLGLLQCRAYPSAEPDGDRRL